MPQQRIDRRCAPTKLHKQLHRLTRPALLEDIVQKFEPSATVENTVLFKLGKRIGRQHLGPFVTVIAGGVTAGEDMTEAVLKAVERNISKPGFETVIRYIYIATDSVYAETFGRRGVLTGFNQYAAPNMNSFRQKVKIWTKASFWFPPYFFPKTRLLNRRRKLYQQYRERYMPDEPYLGIAPPRRVEMVLNTEELATIYHFPTYAVLTAPFIKRVESRRMGPPAGLPIYGGDDLPEAFQSKK